MKIITWNVNGIRSILSKDKNGAKTTNDNVLQELIKEHDPDIICLQEVDGTKTFHIKNPMHIGQKLPFMDKN
jgi:exonuclease III